MNFQELESPVEVRIPFPGFYETPLSSMLGDFERDEAETASEGYCPEDRQSEFREALIEEQCRRPCLDYRRAWRAIAGAYAELFADKLETLTKVKIRYAFSALQSPREYNFVTDQLFLHVEFADLTAVLDKIPRDVLDDAAKRMFTSRDGFWSFYDPEVEKWGRPDCWDHNQWFCVLAAAQDLSCDFKWKDPDWYYYGLNGYELLQECFDYDKFREAVKAKAAELGMAAAPREDA